MWCVSPQKRLMDIFGSAIALLLLSPLFLVVALAVRLSSPGPVIFRQWRVGRGGREFQLLKFRTMTVQAGDGAPGVTRAGDSRVTKVGRWLRKWKLDELPQLLNVLRGEMSLVGPRPDLDDFWRQTPYSSRQVLNLIPGLTGAASIVFRNEEDLLAEIAPEQLTTFYIQKLLPEKARIDLDYASRANFLTDCALMLRTVAVAINNSGKQTSQILQ
jgi:lipopolysaccharide/colanic/teichoic acid biosynthesis glycosyltransferase